jgi:hypothetical protein
MKGHTKASPPFVKTILTMRALWTCLALVTLQHLIGLGSPTPLLLLASVAGIVAATFLAHSKITLLGLVAVTIGLITGALLAIDVVNYSLEKLFHLHFFADSIGIHITTSLGIALACGLLTWGFWRVRAFLYLEALAASLSIVTLCAGHRQYHLDQPKIVSSLAWYFGVNTIYMLNCIGIMFALASIFYLYCAAIAVRPRTESAPVSLIVTRKRFAISTILALLFCAPLLLLQSILYRHYHRSLQSRVANGVGMEHKEGVSPLSFQSALGSSNQPAALVRLEGDYTDNPFVPMLYLRESALSHFNGKELVFAGRGFDDDLPAIEPSGTFSRPEDIALLERTPLVQSVYTLADHKNAFAIDYPVSIVQLKNPRPKRFKSSYRAYSIAPAYEMGSLSSRAVGDRRWSLEIRSHFLTLHTDKRYGELAAEISQSAQTPVDKMLALTTYLSRTAIYTLTPNHAVDGNGDPVAPFLFGDHRGYCVHFAHALVYMARSLGIPSRIGTGYLTDLSQAKDGHILLRMSDRHAWAEIFIEGVGWTPFDVQPDQVESHAETAVDAKLLEELMGILEPGEEILPPELTADEPGMEADSFMWIPSIRQVRNVTVTLLLLAVLLKLFIRNRWRVTSDPAQKIKWSYRAVSSILYDMHIDRYRAETTKQFALRAPILALKEISSMLNEAAYCARPRLSNKDIEDAMRRVAKECSMMPIRTRLVIRLNPRSILRAASSLIGGGRW